MFLLARPAAGRRPRVMRRGQGGPGLCPCQQWPSRAGAVRAGVARSCTLHSMQSMHRPRDHGGDDGGGGRAGAQLGMAGWRTFWHACHWVLASCAWGKTFEHVSEGVGAGGGVVLRTAPVPPAWRRRRGCRAIRKSAPRRRRRR